MNWRDLVHVGLSLDPLLAVRRRLAVEKSHVVVLMYHDLAPDAMDIEAWTVVRRSDFLRQVDYVREHYEVVGLDEALVRMSNKDFGERPLAVFTFDDGGSGNSTILHPIVKEMGLPVTVYVATGQVETGISPWFDQVINLLQTESPIVLDLSSFALGKYLINHSRGSGNWSRIQALLEDMKRLSPSDRPAVVSHIADRVRVLPNRRSAAVRPMSVAELQQLAALPGVTIGAHSHCHNLLTQIGHDAAEESIRTSVQLLSKWTGKEIAHFAYPNGSFDDRLISLVKAMGIRSAMTTEARRWTPGESNYKIPRLSVGRYDTMARFKVSLLRSRRAAAFCAPST